MDNSRTIIALKRMARHARLMTKQCNSPAGGCAYLNKEFNMCVFAALMPPDRLILFADSPLAAGDLIAEEGGRDWVKGLAPAIMLKAQEIHDNNFRNRNELFEELINEYTSSTQDDA